MEASTVIEEKGSYPLAVSVDEDGDFTVTQKSAVHVKGRRPPVDYIQITKGQAAQLARLLIEKLNR